MYYTPFRNKRDNLWVWLFYSHFWGIFCQPYRYLSQTFGADGHFEVLNMSKSQLDQKLKAKTQIILFLFFFNFGRKNHENLWLINANFFYHFWSLFGQLTKNHSQKWGLDSHFEVLNLSESWLGQDILVKMIKIMAKNASFQGVVCRSEFCHLKRKPALTFSKSIFLQIQMSHIIR